LCIHHAEGLVSVSMSLSPHPCLCLHIYNRISIHIYIHLFMPLYSLDVSHISMSLISVLFLHRSDIFDSVTEVDRQDVRESRPWVSNAEFEVTCFQSVTQQLKMSSAALSRIRTSQMTNNTLSNNCL